jgi:hypothetical protein
LYPPSTTTITIKILKNIAEGIYQVTIKALAHTPPP